METIWQSQRRLKMCSAPVSQPPTPNTGAGSISTITVGILSQLECWQKTWQKPPWERADQTYCKWLQSVWANRLPVNQQILVVQVNEMELRTIKHHPWSQECLPYTPVDLAPVVVQQVAAVKIPMSWDRGSPIWPWLSPMMMSSLMTHTRLYLLRMPLLFLTFQDRISKGSTRVIFYQQRSLHFEESTTMSQVMSGPAALLCLPGITL